MGAQGDNEGALGYPPFVCTDGLVLPVSARGSARARRTRIVFAVKGSLEVVVPQRGGRPPAELAPRRVADLLEERRAWIERTARRLATIIVSYQASAAAGLPSCIEFPPLGERWAVEYRPTGADSVTARALAPAHTLRLSGCVHKEELCLAALRRFVLRHAKRELPLYAWRVYGWLAASQHARGYPRPSSITVNSHKRAWGLCTRDARIRIDRRVVFLPEALARQIVLHELAHIRHHNHSPAFYEELYSFEGSDRAAEKELSQAVRHVPAWFA
ncbi:MAG: M48 family metallopeptidase [Coriobacteriales bacterium]|jgi:predicted metal-dependent hydrolase|nr:M48 family metallopeptidase [Coriobacteriales bacterium]